MYWRTNGDIFAIAVKGQGVDEAIHSLAHWPGWEGPIRLSHRQERWVVSRTPPKCFSVGGHQWSTDGTGKTVCKHCLTYCKEGIYYW